MSEKLAGEPLNEFISSFTREKWSIDQWRDFAEKQEQLVRALTSKNKILREMLREQMFPAKRKRGRPTKLKPKLEKSGVPLRSLLGFGPPERKRGRHLQQYYGHTAHSIVKNIDDFKAKFPPLSQIKAENEVLRVLRTNYDKDAHCSITSIKAALRRERRRARTQFNQK